MPPDDRTYRFTSSGKEPVYNVSESILTDLAQDAIFILDRAGNYVFINEAGARPLGISKESIVGRNVRDLFPVEGTSFMQALESVFVTGKSLSTIRKATIGGKRLLFSALLVPINDNDGKVQSAFVIARDITWMKALAKTAKINHQRIRKLFNNMGEGVGMVDPDENFQFANPAAHAIFGAPPGQLKNCNLRDFVSEEGWQQVRSQTDLRRKGARSTYQLEIRRPDGKTRFLQVTVTSRRSRSGRYLGAFGVFSDVTVQRAAEEELRKTSERLEEKVAERTALLSRVVEELQRQIRETQEAVTARQISDSRFRAIFDSALDAVFFKDRELRYMEVNGGVEKLFQKPAAELVGKFDRELFTDEDGIVMQAEDQRVLAGEVVDLEIPRTVNSITRVFHVIKVPVRDIDGRIIGLCGIARDVTQRKMAEQELIESRERLRQLTAYAETSREEEKKRISREIHDELGQSLTVAKYELAALRKVEADRPELMSRLDSLDSRLDAVTQDVRRIAQNLRPPLLDHFGLQAAIECLAKNFQGTTGIQCDFLPTTSSAEIQDSAAISVFRVCQEALTNAARHSGAKNVKVVLSGDDSQFRVEITDDGNGIKPGDLVKPTLGLLGMEERIRRLGGVFQIGLAGARGTRVTVTVPATKSPGKQGP